MSASEVDISTALDELLKDDEVFSELQDLPLEDGNLVSTGQLCGTELNSFDLSFLFSDLNEETLAGMCLMESHGLGTPECTVSHPLSSMECVPQVADNTVFDFSSAVNRTDPKELLEQQQQQYRGCEEKTTTYLLDGGQEQVDFYNGEHENTSAVMLAAVQHDHPYAMTATPVHSVMKTCDIDGIEVEGGSDSGSAEDSSHYDAGYETMSSTMSPDSKSSSSDHPADTPPLSSSALSLLPDPVKLIDERIKFFMSTQQVSLTAEEKDTLLAEGLPVPTTLPLTKVEERALKSVRRKIRNKVAAQESRKKKKEYIQCLEERMKLCSEQNQKLKRKVDNLQTENRTLLQQLQQLQALVARTNPIFRPVQLGSCLMVVVLCFAILFGNMLPYKVTLSSTQYASTATVRSRALLSLDTPHSNSIMDWVDFYKNLLQGQRTETMYMPTTNKHDMGYQSDNDIHSETELDANNTNPQIITAGA